MKRFAMTLAAVAFAVPVYAQNLAVVNGEPITQKSYDQFIQLLVSQGAPDTPQLREQVKEEMINRVIMVQAAEKAGVSDDPAVHTELELTRQGILVRALMSEYLEKNPVTQEKIQAEYDKLKAEHGQDVEYQVRHILVEEESLANDLLKQIKDKKASFEELAKEHSKDPGSAAEGGSLGWAQAENYVAPFAEAVKSTPKGQMADKPVQSQFGWHIVEVIDERPIEFPSFDQVSTQLQEMMREEELAKYQQKLRADAKIEE
ncbi:peptidylprolyl isomerase [Orrella marina]|uniref:peptidylprolyl isomerase n=1 Tax=Orrella marina TaxID=2163011 RepID=A0A2R4XJP4_9BURK|nr:peptidylprolyl isomerase [Orrella marina]AWB34062.1 peptidylprolyl isomerase [Orrella marina]